MLDQFKNLKHLAGMLGDAKGLRERFEQVQAELAGKRVTADAGAGAVEVTMNGKLEVVSVRIEPAMVAALAGEGAEADREMIEELIASAPNAAMQQAQELIRSEMSQAAGGLDLPGM